jgi:hypothetical protein
MGRRRGLGIGAGEDRAGRMMKNWSRQALECRVLSGSKPGWPSHSGGQGELGRVRQGVGDGLSHGDQKSLGGDFSWEEGKGDVREALGLPTLLRSP